MTRNKTLLMVAVLAALGAGTAVAATQTTPSPRAALDRNADGVIDRSEAAAHPRLAEHFDMLDRNKDGKLGADERPSRGKHGHRRHGDAGQWMKRMDTDNDGRISKTEAAATPRFAERFATMDANSDGFLDQKDRVLREKQRRDEWFAKADTDKDGKLSRAEVDAADAHRREAVQQRMHARAEARFTDIDANKDGRISRDEAKGKPRLEERFDQRDSNRDGVITPDELKPRMQR